MELQRNVYVLRRWWWLLVLAFVIGAGVAYLGTKLLVKQKYQSTSVIAVAPPPQAPTGLYLTSLAATADAQLIPTSATAREALASGNFPGVTASQVAGASTAQASVEGELLFVTVHWSDAALAPSLANAMANTFISQERLRLDARYGIIHRSLTDKEQALKQLMRNQVGSGPARDWLQAQYADAVSKVFQQDADARTQALLQEAGLQAVQPATPSDVQTVGPSAKINALLGGVLALALAVLLAYLATSSYEDASPDASFRSVLPKAVE